MKPLMILACLAAFAGTLPAQDAPAKKAKPAAAAPEGAETVVSKAYYPDAVCVVLDKKLTPGKIQTVEANGRTLQVCCKRCVATVNKDAAPWIAKLDQRIVANQKPHYPLDTCPISGHKLGSMGDPHDVVVDNRLVRLCCEGCAKDLADKDAKAKALAMLDAALVAKYGNTAATCPVSHAAIAAGKGINLIYGTVLVRLCGKDCVAKFESDAAKYMAAMHEASPGHGAEPGAKPATGK